jgi:hypothetical protein
VVHPASKMMGAASITLIGGLFLLGTELALPQLWGRVSTDQPVIIRQTTKSDVEAIAFSFEISDAASLQMLRIVATRGALRQVSNVPPELGGPRRQGEAAMSTVPEGCVSLPFVEQQRGKVAQGVDPAIRPPPSRSGRVGAPLAGGVARMTEGRKTPHLPAFGLRRNGVTDSEFPWPSFVANGVAIHPVTRKPRMALRSEDRATQRELHHVAPATREIPDDSRVPQV